jgi:hypothetical protein
MNNIWIETDHTSLFLVEDIQRKYCHYARVNEIAWGRKNTETCDYCGQLLVDDRCASCGAPVSNNSGSIKTGKAVVILSGIISKSMLAFDFRDNSTFEIYNIHVGRKDNHEAGDLFMRLSGCKMITRRMVDVVSFVYVSNEPIEYQIEFECLVDVFPVK